ncbi:MAG: ATP-grasp domain-containing protein [Archangium sp.]|nr:ATP-grasp domain-containing protein [Archangium sp.]MDP3152215.1 ATP-grasp domain-containing protein [Archangium sp.]MDP3571060.1 ATP-grasp domain-containing protein [Archangium sp.]
MSSDVIILFGGSSSERHVSVASAQNVSKHLPEAACWFIAPQGAVFAVERAELAAHANPFEAQFAPRGNALFPSLGAALDSPAAKAHTFFLALHGGDGENGVTQLLLEERGLAFTGSGSKASADAFDKAKTKKLASAQGAKVAEARILPPMNVAEAKAALTELLTLNPRWVLKPQADGSSHGLIHLRNAGQLEASAEALAGFKLHYLAEVFIEGRELTVGVVDDEGGTAALPVSEVRLIPGGAFDYAGKYLGRGTEEITPAELTAAESQAAQALAVLTHRALSCAGYSRTDMILTPSGLVLLEINTLPGMTKASFIPQQLAAAGRDVMAFITRQLTLARNRRDGGR